MTLTLLRHRADISAVDASGYTALAIAVEQDQPRTTELLIQNGALDYGPRGLELLGLVQYGESEDVPRILLKQKVISESEFRDIFNRMKFEECMTYLRCFRIK
jgi:hypothetical protein